MALLISNPSWLSPSNYCKMRTSSCRSPNHVGAAFESACCVVICQHLRSPKRRLDLAGHTAPIKRCRLQETQYIKYNNANAFDSLSDDLVVSILVCLSSSSASSPADLISVMLTCKRFHTLGMHTMVLATANTASLAVRASSWSEGSHRFIRRCAESGNVEACYTLGMIRFYCLQDKQGGLRLLAKAAVASHAGALLSLAIIQFNGSGRGRKDKNASAGAALCTRAALAGSVDALRELGHCLQDGHGLPPNPVEGRRLLLAANAKEARVFLSNLSRKLTGFRQQDTTKVSTPLRVRHTRTRISAPLQPESEPTPAAHQNHRERLHRHYCRSLLSVFDCAFPLLSPAEYVHPVNIFLTEWFALRPPPEGLRLCSHSYCGRPETRKHEFRRCSACSTVNYCSRACQAMDWKFRHKLQCQPILHIVFRNHQ